MRRQLLESRALDMVEAVLSGRRVEDGRVEMKSEWPADHRWAARQIAGLANAAAGANVVWILGVDEDGGRLVDPGHVEPGEWRARVERCFSELAPEMAILTVPVSGAVVTVLAFDSSRAPYMANTTGAGGVNFEIPWREGNATRTARRSEILRSLVGKRR